MDLQSEKYELSFDIKKYTTSGWALEDENVIGIRAFKVLNVKVAHTEYLCQYFAVYTYSFIQTSSIRLPVVSEKKIIPFGFKYLQ